MKSLLVEAAEHVLRQHGDHVGALGDRGDVAQGAVQLEVLEREHRMPLQVQLAVADRAQRTRREARALGDELLRRLGAVVAVHLHGDVDFLAAGAGFHAGGQARGSTFR